MKKYYQCINEVTEALGRELTEKEVDQTGIKVEGIIKKLQKNGVSEQDLDVGVLAAIEKEAVEDKIRAVQNKANEARNARQRIEMYDFVKRTKQFDQGLLAYFDKSLADFAGSKNGASRQIAARRGNYLSGLAARLSKEGVLEVAKSGKFDPEIFEARAELNSGGIKSKFQPEVVKTAQILNDFREMMRLEANKAGAQINKLSGYVQQRTHDPLKISKAAGIGKTNEENFNAWKKDFDEAFNWRKDLQDEDVPDAEQERVLHDIYNQLATGIHVSFSPPSARRPLKSPAGYGNLGKKHSYERVFTGKSPKAEYAYSKKYGYGNTLVENDSIAGMHMARDTALMLKFGPNAQSNIEIVVEKIKKDLIREDRTDELKTFENEYKSIIDNLWPELTGATSIPANETFAKWSYGARVLQTMGDLGGAVISTLNDIGAAASNMNYYGDRTFGAFWKGAADTLGGILGRAITGKKLSPDEKQLMAEAGIISEGLSNIANTFSSGDPIIGELSKFNDLFFTLNLQNWQSNAAQIRSIMAMGSRHAYYAKTAYKDLPPGMRASLEHFEIPEEVWNIIRKAPQKVDNEGRSFLLPETLRDVPLEKFQDLPDVKAKKISAEAMRDKIIINYRSLFSDVAATNISQPGAGERAIMLQGTKSGSWQGEVWRHFWMYKSFTTSIIRNHLGRELHGYNAMRATTGEALTELVKGKRGSSFVGLANMMALGAITGFISFTAKDLWKGREARIPHNAEEFGKIFAASMLQSGALGIYGDFLFGEAVDRFGRGPLETFLGPTWSTATDITRLINKARQGKGEDLAAEAFKFALGNTPGVNAAYSLFYTRWALDYLIVYRLQEMMNPGYLSRMERTLQSQKDQEFLVPPSSVVPFGG